MTADYVASPFNVVHWAIVRDADWSDSLPVIKEGGDAIDLTDLVLDWYIRPTYDHSILIKKLSTDTGEIVITDGPAGQAAVFLARADVIDDLPVGTFDQFLVLTDEAGSPDSHREVFRGRLVVHAGKISG